MRLLLINPNTSEGITNRILARARKAASPGLDLSAATAAFGARYIGSRSAAAIASHAVIDAWARAADRDAPYDGVLLACFGDPGLDALREIADVPVTGMAEASCLLACALGRRFAIVTGGERWGPMLTEFVGGMGLSDRLTRVRTISLTGGAIAENPEAAHASLVGACNQAVADDGADVVILGGAGLVGIAEQIADRVPAPLIDCLDASLGALEAMVSIGARKAASGPGSRPDAVETTGLGDALTRFIERR